MFPLTATNRLQHGAEKELGCCWVNSWYDWSFFRNSTMRSSSMRRVGVPEPTLPVTTPWRNQLFGRKVCQWCSACWAWNPRCLSNLCSKLSKLSKGVDDWFWNQKRAGFIWRFCLCCFFLVVTFLSHGKCWKLLHLNLGAAVCQTCWHV